ncbi:MAG: radical SAM protein [Rhodopseudomonas palustris]|nr:radical SAM protein [Rhodopseudomonas palustris]
MILRLANGRRDEAGARRGARCGLWRAPAAGQGRRARPGAHPGPAWVPRARGGEPMRFWSAPLEVFLGVTSDCNLRCRHCGVASTHDTPALDTAAWLRIVAEVGALKMFSVRVTSGEPLVRPDLHTLLEALDRLPLEPGDQHQRHADRRGAGRTAGAAGAARGRDGRSRRRRRGGLCRRSAGHGVFERTTAAIQRLVRRGCRRASTAW